MIYLKHSSLKKEKNNEKSKSCKVGKEINGIKSMREKFYRFCNAMTCFCVSVKLHKIPVNCPDIYIVVMTPLHSPQRR